MNKYSILTNQEISKIFAENQGLLVVEDTRELKDSSVAVQVTDYSASNNKQVVQYFNAFDADFCFSLIEEHRMEITDCGDTWQAHKTIKSKGKNVTFMELILTENKDLNRAILECVLMIEDKK